MSVDTKGLLKGKVTPDEIINFIRQTFDPNAKAHIKFNNYGDDSGFEWIKERYDDSGEWKDWHGFIDFYDGISDRELFYCYTNHNSLENLEYYSEFGLEDMVKEEITYISLNKDESSIDGIKKIAAHFGGWIDEDDCDDEPYYPILKNENGTIKPVVHVTMTEVYEKFGATVIIDK